MADNPALHTKNGAVRRQKLLGALSLCKKAGALTAGFDAVCQSARTGQAALLLFAGDTSPATQKRVLQVAKRGLPTGVLPLTQQDIAAVTQKQFGVLAVTNKDLAALCQKALAFEEERV